ncbi:carbohydrate esterase family 1 protein [Annulohypoxylon maeteangense]|uniref:carbohydrate esterase family 1 protein n=1 Tax=Annulohypoxylon maeteangense TaxID=1927788 RepID=UPI00200744BD|nr:carbohydrate esterase family 1 protein [Annulohypoxylon maeteangense]KAI0885734.1 carbohydrate esterase family 1 protein [Annulohypoxylon maeteangense]
MFGHKFLGLLALCALRASASVTVRKTNKGPTGYEVDFKYTNTTAKRVIIGDLQLFTDQLHTTLDNRAWYSPKDYQPGDFPVNYGTQPVDLVYPYEMTSEGDGLWTFTTPLPAGIYQYHYLIDCDYAPNCTIVTGQLVTDPDNPPFQNVIGDQVASNFQVPYDPQFQATNDISADYDYALPAPAEYRGTIKSVNYTSPGSIHPAPDVHHLVLYLPAEYGKIEGKKYPLLYLSHGAAGNANDWENQGRVSAILDNLIAGGHIEPTVVVMPSFYNLDDSLPRFIMGDASTMFTALPSSIHIRENYQKYLFPWVEQNLEVCSDPSCRAFAGLSWGGRLTYEMYVNATDYFSWFGMFSAATSAPYIDNATLAANPALAQKGVFVAYGLYDSQFEPGREIQAALDSLSIGHLSRVTPVGAHWWNTWQDELWWFGVKALWKPYPYNTRSGR